MFQIWKQMYVSNKRNQHKIRILLMEDIYPNKLGQFENAITFLVKS